MYCIVEWDFVANIIKLKDQLIKNKYVCVDVVPHDLIKLTYYFWD